MLIMSAWVAYETFDDQKTRIQQKLEQTTNRIDTALTQEINNASYLLDAVGHQLLKHAKNDPYGILNIFQTHQLYRTQNKILFSWINQDQRLLVSSDYGIADVPVDVSDRDYVKRAINKPWQPVIGSPIKGRISKRWVVPLSLGITDSDGEFLGVLFMGLDIEHIKQTALAASGDKNIDFTITNRAFTLLTSTYEKPSVFKRHFDLSELAKLDFLEQQASLYASARPWNSRTVFAYYQTAPLYPFIYFLTYNHTTSAQELKQVLTARIFQLIAVGSFLLFVLWTVRKRIIQPVIALSDSTRAATLGSTFETVAYHGPQEIQTLNREIYKFWLYTQERKRIEAELRHKLAELIRIRDAAVLTNKIKAEFFAFVEEILRAPTQMILEQSETIKDQHFGAITNPKYLKNATEIYQCAQSILKILDDMLKISAAETGMIELKEETLDISQLLRKSLQLFNELNQKPLQLQVDNQSPLPRIEADKQRLRQLFMHIYTIVAAQTNAGDTLRVSSNIRAGQLHLFFSFAHNMGQPTPTLDTEEALNTSMAVALARLLAAMHQGSFEIKTTPDKITTLTLKLPVNRVKGE